MENMQYRIKELDVLSYRKVNESFGKRMICRIGIDCGFFVEMNYMLNAMLYCLARNIRFQLYSESANFGTGIGWTEYFLPFCEEVHDSFHREYNLHRPPSWGRVLRGCMRQKSAGLIKWKIKSVLKTAMGRVTAFRVYKEYVLFAQDVAYNPDEHYYVPELGMDCDYYEAYGLLARMVWKLQPTLQHQKDDYTQALALPARYDGIQVRGGDKVTEAVLVSGARMMQLLNPQHGDCVFVLTDDYRQFQVLQNGYPGVRFLTLCLPEARGYVHKNFCQQSSDTRRQAIIRLIISVDLLLGTRSFIGSITTGPSVFVMKQRFDDPCVQAVDCPKHKLSSSLSLTIGERSAISKKHLKS